MSAATKLSAPSSEPKGEATSLGSAFAMIRLTNNEIPLLSEVMGSEIMNIVVGPRGAETAFAVHKNLVVEAGGAFKAASQQVEPGQRLVLSNEDPAAFKLLVELLYTRQVPGVSANMQVQGTGLRIRHLCQLYALADKLELKFTLRNLIMDKIQDGFATINKLPYPALIQRVYEHTKPGSQLRKFCAACMVFELRSPDFVDNGSVKEIISTKNEFLDDFLQAVRNFEDMRDPRVRDCQGENGGCIDCIEKPAHGARPGFWTCTFHIHAQQPASEGRENDGKVEEPSATYSYADGRCHLFRA